VSPSYPIYAVPAALQSSSRSIWWVFELHTLQESKDSTDAQFHRTTDKNIPPFVFFFASITGLLGGHIKKSTTKYNDDVSCVRALPILRSWTPSSGGGGSMWSFNTRQIYGMPWKSV
jgi:hypothetical protein